MVYKVSLIILYDCEKRLLLQHRTKDAKVLPNHWAFFGGGLNNGETPDTAVRREALEELNCRLQAPILVLDQDFKEGSTEGHLYVYVEPFVGDKAVLKLREGQGWGWFKESEIGKLKMVDRDRQIIRFITHYLERNWNEFDGR